MFIHRENHDANEGQYRFMLEGLPELAASLKNLNITFTLTEDNPLVSMEGIITELNPSMIITEFNPIRSFLDLRNQMISLFHVPVFEVDAHNIVPCRVASDKNEFGAYTLRSKINRKLNEFLVPFPAMIRHPFSLERPLKTNGVSPADFKNVHLLRIRSGESAAHIAMVNFFSGGLEKYEVDRNDPTLNGQSGLSPYLHSGQISAQRIVIEILEHYREIPSSASFLEELIIRRELSDNFCFYNEKYDSFEGFPAWAKKTLNDHRDDKREYYYSGDTFEKAATHDKLWNAAQLELMITGKMHGYLRMYWAKKILEWTATPEEALAIATWLNDKYSLDGNDPNGYAGIAWSIGGVHDRAWGERPVFGKIRFMNEKGSRRKFDVDAYISKINLLNGS